MQFLVYAIIVLVATVFQIAVFSQGDIALVAVIAILFFRSVKPALILSVIFGYVFDLFSPFFGIHLLAYPATVFLAALVYQKLLTDQSILSFSALSLGSFLLLTLIEGAFFSALSAAHVLPGGLPLLLVIRSEFVALLFQVFFTIIFYLGGTLIADRFRTRYAQAH